MLRDTTPLSVQLAQEMRHRIITGAYPQGMRLTEQRIAEELDVSRVPVRESIPLLEYEGFVQASPRQGVVVRSWTSADVDDIFDARLALEGRAAWRAAQRSSMGIAPDLLREAYRSAEGVLHTGDRLTISLVNARYHEALVAASGNQLFVKLMSAVAGRMAWLFYLTSDRDMSVACAEHGAITEAVVEGSGLLAQSLVEAHIESGRRPTLGILQQLANDETDSLGARQRR